MWAAPRPSSAFKTWPNNVHLAIHTAALKPVGFQPASIEAMAKGCDSQDWVPTREIRPPEKFTDKPQHHGDDNLYREGFEYIRERLQTVADSGDGAYRTSAARDRTLYVFGEALHTLQDFYSHSNYLEWVLHNKKPFVPLEWADWSRPPQFPPGCRTGYFFWNGVSDNETTIILGRKMEHVWQSVTSPISTALSRTPNTVAEGRERVVSRLTASHPALKFHADAVFRRRLAKPTDYALALQYALADREKLHYELNKDAPGELQGGALSPGGNTFHSLARRLAASHTAKIWSQLETEFCKEHEGKAAWIVAGMKGKPLPKVAITLAAGSTAKAGQPVRGRVKIRVTNVEPSVVTKLREMGKPLMLDIEGNLHPVGQHVQVKVPYAGHPEQEIVLERDVPLRVPADASGDLELKLAVSISPDPLTEPQFAEASLKVGPAGGLERSVLFLVDTSGSMQGAKIAAARKSVADLIRQGAQHPGAEEWAILSFSEHNVYEIIPFGTDAAAAQAAAAGLQAAGDTPLHYAEAKALTYLLKNGKAVEGRLIILCDGDNSCPGPAHARGARHNAESSSSARSKLLTRLKLINLPGRQR